MEVFRYGQIFQEYWNTRRIKKTVQGITEEKSPKREIAIIQEFAFQSNEDAHGYSPRWEDQKQIAYDFMIDFLRNMEVTECVGCLKPLGIPLVTAIKFWHGLEDADC